jgi:hypothetical protein
VVSLGRQREAAVRVSISIIFGGCRTAQMFAEPVMQFSTLCFGSLKRRIEGMF